MVTFHSVFFLLLTSLILASCGGGSGNTPTTPLNGTNSASANTGVSSTETDTNPNCKEYQNEETLAEDQTQTPTNTFRCSMRHDSLDRVFYLYVPTSYAAGTTQAATLFSLHGYTSNALLHLSYTGFEKIANEKGFIVVYPQGSILKSTGSTHWNVGGWTNTSTTDDVSFLSTIIDYLSTRYSVNLDRIYSTGMSNGGFMSYHLACNLSSKIAAVASVTGSMTPETYDTCNPVHPTPVLQIHGKLDNTVPYEGSPGMKPIKEVIAYWSQHNGCNSTPTEKPIIDSDGDGDGGTQSSYSGCLKNAEVTLKLLDGMGHEWPVSSAHDIDASLTIWNFLSQYDRYGLIE